MPNPDHGNHYAQAERAKAVADLDSALRAGRVQAADSILDAYDVRALMESVVGKIDPVVERCGGAVMAEYGQQRLRARRSCRF
jgi:hypothetical protein